MLDVVMLACPELLSGTVPRFSDPDVNVTVPDGMLWPGAVTVAENVTVCPAVNVLLEADSEVDVERPPPTATV